jgi:RNA polymerase sigma-70 factor (ECF subfamily)
MAIPVAVGARPRTRIAPAGAWRRLWHVLLTAVPGRLPEPDPAPGLAAADAGEGPTFTDLFARYRLSLIDYLYGMTRDRELAADLAQDTFVRALAAAPDLAGIHQPRAWLYRIATHVALNANRHRRHFEWLPLSRVAPEDGEGDPDHPWFSPMQPPQDPGDLAADVAERDAVWAALAELPPRWRAVLLLQTTGGFEVREIAALLGLSEANVRKVLFRAKERFRALYDRRDARGGAG